MRGRVSRLIGVTTRWRWTSRRDSRLLDVLGGVAILVVLPLVLVMALRGVSPGQTPAAKPAVAAPAAPAGALPPGYVGAETCKGCHEDAWNRFNSTKMGRLFMHRPRDQKERLACETCHGPGKAHVDAGGGKGVGGIITFAKDDKTPVDRRNAVCQQCHTKGPRLFWQGSPHESRDVACTTCHRVMEDLSPHYSLAKPNEIDLCGTCHEQRKAQTMRSSHMPLRESKMTCTSCHNPHGTVTPALLKENSTNDTCYNCHTEKRGPFLWQHPPVTENCANCHDPHGSNHEKMLKVAKPRLCQECHVTNRHPTTNYGRGVNAVGGNQTKYTFGRGCTNCHVNIHGSNHPAGFAFVR